MEQFDYLKQEREKIRFERSLYLLPALFHQHVIKFSVSSSGSFKINSILDFFGSYVITEYIVVVVKLLYGGMPFCHVPHLRITKREEVGKEEFIKMKRRSIKHTVILEKLSASESAHEQQAIGAKNTSSRIALTSFGPTLGQRAKTKKCRNKSNKRGK